MHNLVIIFKEYPIHNQKYSDFEFYDQVETKKKEPPDYGDIDRRMDGWGKEKGWMDHFMFGMNEIIGMLCKKKMLR